MPWSKWRRLSVSVFMGHPCKKRVYRDGMGSYEEYELEWFPEKQLIKQGGYRWGLWQL